MSQVQTTTDYTKFKLIKGNRKIHRGHLEALELAILKKNLLDANPAIVNENMEIIDGQHRYEVAKKNELPFSYIVMKGIGLSEVQMINSHLRNWNPMDYLRSNIELGNKEYELIKQFMDDHGISISTALLYLIQSADKIGIQPNNGLRVLFKTGSFKVEDLDYAEYLVGLTEETKPILAATVFSDRDYHLAVMKVSKSPIFDAEILKTKVAEVKDFRLIDRKDSVKDYIYQIDDVYNFKAKKPQRLF